MPSAALTTGLQARQASRAGTLDVPTSGVAPSYLQANLIVLPSRYANDFRLLCQRNPVPCPLLAESATPGAYSDLTSHVHAIGSTKVLPAASDIDLRYDAPRYRLYVNGKPAGGADPQDIASQWTDDHVGFLIGCSYSFEDALAAAGLPPRHMVQNRNVPMYRSSLRLCPAGVFTKSTYVVSMRPYRAADVEKVRDITRRFVTTHGEPVAWGWEALEQLGISDITKPQWGDAALRADGSQPFDQSEEEYVPVFWGCGVTPQEAVMRAELEGTVMGHAPGYMILLDVKDTEVFPDDTSK